MKRVGVLMLALVLTYAAGTLTGMAISEHRSVPIRSQRESRQQAAQPETQVPPTTTSPVPVAVLDWDWDWPPPRTYVIVTGVIRNDGTDTIRAIRFSAVFKYVTKSWQPKEVIESSPTVAQMTTTYALPVPIEPKSAGRFEAFMTAPSLAISEWEKWLESLLHETDLRKNRVRGVLPWELDVGSIHLLLTTVEGHR